MKASLEEYKEITEKPKRKCWNCKGTGKIKFKIQKSNIPCLLCDGSGFIIDEDKDIIRGGAKTGLTGRRGRRDKLT